MVLKGGLVVELRLARVGTTKDIDLNAKGTPEAILERLQDAGRLDLDDFLRYEVSVDTKHPEIECEGMVYQGHRFQARAMLAGKVYGNPFGIDVAFGDPMFGAAEQIQGSDFLGFAGIEPVEYTVYPLETHIAEQLHAYTMPRDRINSRVKDLPDMALLGSVRAIRASYLRSAIEGTFSHRNTHDIPLAIPDPPAIWKPVYQEMQESDGLPWNDIDDLVEAVRAFIEPVLMKEQGMWNPESWRWESEAD